MVKTSKQIPTNTKCPVNLITGLLGSGKTTFIQHLLKTKPQDQIWGLLINDFGEIGIDAATLQASETNAQPIVEVSGGCLCCTAFQGYQQALSTLLSQNVDRILVEPTGLGHPAKIIDLLKQPPFNEQLFISGIISVATAQQLTPEHWQKSAIMRDIITLADTLIINKTDLGSQTELDTTKALLASIYPPKENLIFSSLKSQTNAITPSLVDFKQIKQPFYLLAGLAEHAQQTEGDAQHFSSSLPLCTGSKIRIGSTSTVGWVFDSALQFHRTRFLAWLDALASNKSHQLLRAKGLIKTGNEWQQLNWVDGNAQLSDIAWRQDSRLELIFNTPLTPQNIISLEANLSQALFTRHQSS